MSQEFQMRQRVVVIRIPILEQLPIPAQGLVVEAVCWIEIDGFRVMAFVRRVLQHPTDLRHCAALVSSAAADERSADVMTEIDWLVLPPRFGNVEDQKCPAVVINQPCPRRHDAVQFLARTEDAKKVVLDFVHVVDADDFESTRGIPDAENQPPALGVGKGRDRFISRIGHAALGQLDFEIGPFVPLEAFDKLLRVHRCLGLSCLDVIQDEPAGF